jgi:hypothetical protein
MWPRHRTLQLEHDDDYLGRFEEDGRVFDELGGLNRNPMDKKQVTRREAAAKAPTPRSKSMMLPMAPAIASKIALDYHLTLEVLRSGHGDEYHLGSMAQATYTAMRISQLRDTSVRPGLFCEAKDAILRSRQAGLETGFWIADEQSCALLAEILAVLDQQLATVPLEDFKSANESLKKIFGATNVDRKGSDVCLRPPVHSKRDAR